jgi:hypothetical protein
MEYHFEDLSVDIECEATGPLSRSYDGAVDMWNFRAKPDGDGQ